MRVNDISGTLGSNSTSNLIGVGGGLVNGVQGNIVGINDPQLTPLGADGGPTPTMAPQDGSPAINAGNNSLIPSGITTDQRGYPRIVGSSVDIGAVEWNGASVNGLVVNDANGDGVQDAGETGLSGVTVYADLNNSGTLNPNDPSAITNSSGNYTLNGIPEGAVIIRQVLPAGNRQSYPVGSAGEHVTVGAATVNGANFADSTRLYISGTVTINGVGQSGLLVYADLNHDGKFESNENNKLTTSGGGFAFQSLNPGTYTFRVVPPVGDVQTSPAGGGGISVTLGSGGVDVNVNFALAKKSARFSGTVIGTPGSYNNQGNTAVKAFDGNLSTFFDAPTPSGNYVGLDLGSAKVIGSIGYAPRVGFATRMVGGVFQASNSATFSSGIVTLYTVTAAPASGVLTTVKLSNTSTFRYVRYVGPVDSFCNVAELEFGG